MVRQAQRSASLDARFAANEYVTMQVEVDGEMGARAPYAALLRELKQRLGAQPGVLGVTVAERLPFMVHPSGKVEIDDGGSPSPEHEAAVSTAVVDSDFFDVFRAPIVAGRGFDAGDLREGANTVIVDEFFVERILGGRNAVGRRIRDLDANRPEAPGVWQTIVGVVQDVESDRPGSLQLADPPMPFVYRPVTVSGAATPLRLAVHVPAGQNPLLSSLYETAAAVSPALRLHEVQTLDRIASGEVAFWRLWADLLLLVSAVALVLSLAGIYAVMSFTISRRTREIGIRIALGGQAPRVVAEILRGPIVLVGAGIVVGCLLVAGLLWTFAESALTPRDGAGLLALGAAMMGVCTVACLGPALRALRVQPTEALGVES
jgi:hypothetical protein